MNLRDLEYLVAVARYRHFGKAAGECSVSQPALSMQLAKLEKYLGVKLFERTNKQVIITPEGEKIASRAGEILQQADEIKQFARSCNDPCSGEIRIGAFPTLAPYFFPRIVPEIINALPDLKLFLVEEKTEILVQKLRSGHIDAAFLALPVDESGLRSEKLFADRFTLATPPGHSLSKHKDISQEDIRGEKLLLLEEGHCLRTQALDVCGNMDMSEHQDFRATSLETLRQMVASGLGLTLMPSIAVKSGDTIAIVPFREPAPSRTIALFWRNSSARTVCLEKIAEICKEKHERKKPSPGSG